MYKKQVVDNVLKDNSAKDQELYHRARGLLLLGAIFKSTVPDESDEERRELERCAFSMCVRTQIAKMTQDGRGSCQAEEKAGAD